MWGRDEYTRCEYDEPGPSCTHTVDTYEEEMNGRSVHPANNVSPEEIFTETVLLLKPLKAFFLPFSYQCKLGATVYTKRSLKLVHMCHHAQFSCILRRSFSSPFFQKSLVLRAKSIFLARPLTQCTTYVSPTASSPSLFSSSSSDYFYSPSSFPLNVCFYAATYSSSASSPSETLLRSQPPQPPQPPPSPLPPTSTIT